MLNLSRLCRTDTSAQPAHLEDSLRYAQERSTFGSQSGSINPSATISPTEFDIERYLRDASLVIAGEGTNAG